MWWESCIAATKSCDSRLLTFHHKYSLQQQLNYTMSSQSWLTPDAEQGGASMSAGVEEQQQDSSNWQESTAPASSSTKDSSSSNKRKCCWWTHLFLGVVLSILFIVAASLEWNDVNLAVCQSYVWLSCSGRACYAYFTHTFLFSRSCGAFSTFSKPSWPFAVLYDCACARPCGPNPSCLCREPCSFGVLSCSVWRQSTCPKVKRVEVPKVGMRIIKRIDKKWVLNWEEVFWDA